MSYISANELHVHMSTILLRPLILGQSKVISSAYEKLRRKRSPGYYSNFANKVSSCNTQRIVSTSSVTVDPIIYKSNTFYII